MQGNRTDLVYGEICKYIKQHQPISITNLGHYLLKNHDILLNTSRSKLINRLIDLKLIKRIGKPKSRHAEFILYERK